MPAVPRRALGSVFGGSLLGNPEELSWRFNYEMGCGACTILNSAMETLRVESKSENESSRLSNDVTNSFPH